MAYSPIQNVTATPGTDGGTTSSIDTTGADLIVLTISPYISGSILTPSDNKGNTYTQAVTTSSGNTRTTIFYCHAPTVGTGHTFTYQGSLSFCFPTITVSAWSGSSAVPLDQTNSANGSGTSLNAGSITPTTDNQLVITAGCFDAGTSYTVSGYTQIGNANYTGSQNMGGATFYNIQSTATATNPAWSWSGSAGASAAVASFKATGGLVAYLVANGGGTSGSLDTTGATLIIVGMVEAGFTDLFTGDSQGGGSNTYVGLTKRDDSNRQIQLFYSLGANLTHVGTSHTWSDSAAAGETMFVLVFDNASPTFDKESAGAGSSSPTTLQPGTLTPTGTNNLLVTLCGNDVHTPVTISSPFAVPPVTADKGSPARGGGISFVLQTSATQQNPTWTVASDDIFIQAVMAAFTLGGGGAFTPTPGNSKQFLTLMGTGT